MIVVDTNILCYGYLTTEQAPLAEAIWRKDSDWIAPFLWRSEFRNVLALYLRRELLTLLEVKSLMGRVEVFMKDREYQADSNLVLELVNRSACTAYDCEFVALAQHKGVLLLTSDKQILREFPATAVAPAQFLI